MDAALRLVFFVFPNTIVYVSILVLVDAALRREGTANILEDVDSFNPCFDGCRPATHSLTQIRNHNVVFQSLF